MNNLFIRHSGSDVWYKIVDIRRYYDHSKSIVVDVHGDLYDLQDTYNQIIDIERQNIYSHLEFDDLGTSFVGKIL